MTIFNQTRESYMPTNVAGKDVEQVLDIVPREFETTTLLLATLTHYKIMHGDLLRRQLFLDIYGSCILVLAFSLFAK